MHESKLMVTLPAWQTSWWFLTLASAMVLGIALALWHSRSRRLRQEQAAKEAMSRRMQESREKERRRIASELHDSLGQDLLIIKNRCLLALAATPDADAVVAQIEEISKVASQAVEEVRRVAHRLGTHHLEHLGLTQALATMIDQVSASTSIAIEQRLEPIDDLVTGDSAISLYRVAQEALNNVIKHADTASARVHLERDVREIRLVIQDDGRGFEAGRQADGSFGLFDMAEQVRLLGGTFRIRSVPGSGTEVAVALPIRETAHAIKTRAVDGKRISYGG